MYYHCKSSCTIRFKAKQANEHFFEELQLLKPKKNDQDISAKRIIETYSELKKNTENERKKYTGQLNKLDDQIIKARELLLAGDIGISDYNSIKTDYAKKTATLSTQIIAIEELVDSKIDIKNLAQSAVKNLCTLPHLYKIGNFAVKRHIIKTIFPDIIVYNGASYRTTK